MKNAIYHVIANILAQSQSFSFNLWEIHQLFLKKVFVLLKKQFILILELPCKIVQSSKYLIMAKKNKDRYLNIFFSFMMNKMPSFVFLGYLGHEALASDTFPMGVVLLEMS